MSNLKDCYLALKIFIVFCLMIFISGCASIQAPQGGPKDTKPPKVLNMTPKNLTRNFKAKLITIEFDEYFKLNNESKEFTISPEQERAPILKIRQKRLEITLQDSLEKNTTYTLNFGKAVADINEGNVVKNLSYVFSTGNEIDSLSISGKISNALTGELEKEATVLIFPLERDTLFGKRRPSIYTLTDSSGNYKLNNLRKGSYKIYALKESSGGDKIYQQISDEVGFRKDPILIDKNLENINLQVFKENASDFRIIDRRINTDGSILLTFNKQLKKPGLLITDPRNLDDAKRVAFSKTNDTARLWLNDLSFDSVKVAVLDQGKMLQTINLTRSKRDIYTREITAIDNTANQKLNPFHDYTLTFNLPVTNADLSKIILLEDSVKRTAFEVLKDSVDFLKYHVKFPWKQKRNYILNFKGGAFSGTLNAKNKDIEKKFTLESGDYYTTLTLKTQVPDTTSSYIVQFLNEKKEVVLSSVITKNSSILFLRYPPGKYLIRVVYDENKNGKWDTGDLKLGVQPEKIWYSPVEKILKGNWEREDQFVIPPIPSS